MRILLDQAVYDQRNKGNVALLQAAVARLGELWPDASIYVLTEAPRLLRVYCPAVHPVGVHPWQNWSQGGRLRKAIHTAVPAPVLRLLLESREEIWHRFPSLAAGGWRRRLGLGLARTRANQGGERATTAPPPDLPVGDGDAREQSEDFLAAIHNADLVIATGGGYLCDADKEHSLQVYDTLATAIRLGKPAAMVGQGVGPLNDPELRARLKTILPFLDLILVREPKIARPLLASLGVAPERVIATGDDAIEMAFKERPLGWGRHIGVNLRLARYTEVDRGYIEKTRLALQRAARRHDAPLMGLPTSCNIKEADLEVVRQVLRGYDRVTLDWRRFQPPLHLIREIGRCRVVVTGAFHPAVFALAQGIPVVALFKSAYAYDKFDALRDDFGSGCQLIHLDGEDFGETLVAAIDRAWESAEQVRPKLLEAAVRLVESARMGYRLLHDLYEARLAEPQLASRSAT